MSRPRRGRLRPPKILQAGVVDVFFRSLYIVVNRACGVTKCLDGCWGEDSDRY